MVSNAADREDARVHGQLSTRRQMAPTGLHALKALKKSAKQAQGAPSTHLQGRDAAALCLQLCSGRPVPGIRLGPLRSRRISLLLRQGRPIAVQRRKSKFVDRLPGWRSH